MLTVFHNPHNSTSCDVLAMIEQKGMEPTVVDMTETPLSRHALVALLIALELSPRDVLDEAEPAYGELGLDDESLSDMALLDALEDHPALLETPIVLTDKGGLVCRPAEKVLELL